VNGNASRWPGAAGDPAAGAARRATAHLDPALAAEITDDLLDGEHVLAGHDAVDSPAWSRVLARIGCMKVNHGRAGGSRDDADPISPHRLDHPI
jgi:hypothetical protein